jgi:hypothetical protein
MQSGATPRRGIATARAMPMRRSVSHLPELWRLEDERRSVRRARSGSFTVAALLSVVWLARVASSWLPPHLFDFAVALWGTVLAFAVGCGIKEWRLGRRCERLIAHRGREGPT